MTAVTKSADETRSLATAMADVVRAGDLVLLAGDLGSGKTVFAQGLASGLGVDEAVTSPTFILARTYSGRLRLHHVDIYRLDHLHEVLDLGLAEMLDEGAVCVIEWGDVVTAALPADHLEVRLSYGGVEDERLLALRAVGPAWAPRAAALEAAVGPWTGG